MTVSSITKIAQESISLLATEFDVILANDGERYMSISAICDTLGLLAGPQKRRIKRNSSLLCGLRMLTVTTGGGEQTTNCLNISTINAWLEGLQIDTLSLTSRNKLAILQRDLLPLAMKTFPDLSPALPQALPQVEKETEQQEEAPSSETLVPKGLPTFALPITGQQNLLNQLAGIGTSTHLVITHAVEDAAFRESCLADEAAWDMSSTPHFTSSDNVRVYLAPPSQVLDREDALARIDKLGERTVMTARIALGLWNIRRNAPTVLQKNGSVPIGVEEILKWRGIAKHSREAYAGSPIRNIEGFEGKYKQQVYEDFSHLQHCYMYSEQGIPIQFEGPYAYVTIVRAQRTTGEGEILGYLFAPGGWITSQTGQALSQFAVVLAEIFKLKPQRHQIALRIALYLVERWSQLALQGNYNDPIMMGDLLRASIIDIDTSNASRFVARVNAGIQTLADNNILGEVKEYIPSLSRKSTIMERFLSTYISLPPHREVIKKYQEIAQAESNGILPSAPLVQRSKREGKK